MKGYSILTDVQDAFMISCDICKNMDCVQAMVSLPVEAGNLDCINDNEDAAQYFFIKGWRNIDKKVTCPDCCKHLKN